MPAWPLLALCLLGAHARAATHEDLQWHGYLDLRLQADDDPSRGWREGGLAKFADGAAATALLAARWQPHPAWQAAADLQVDSRSHPSAGVLEAWLRSRPVSLSSWRWSLRAGSFFPQVSLENDGIGWTSPWTLSPSAINSWVGEELRSTGLEYRLEHRRPSGRLELGLAGFLGNDPAGELLATRGWALGDNTIALGGWLRQPDVHATRARAQAPLWFQPFVETDHRLGWHADLAWIGAGERKLALMRYDNRADPASSALQRGRRVFSWHTRFTSAGLRWPLGPHLLIAQAMSGSTAFEPRPGRYLDTRFESAFLLWARDDGGPWRPALRLDWFKTRELGGAPGERMRREDGLALTAALAWRPAPRWRISGEWLWMHSDRDQRLLEDLPADGEARQLQLSVRLLF